MKKNTKVTIQNMAFPKWCNQSGQSLITLLFFMVIGLTVITSAALIVASDFLSSSNAEQGIDAYYAAESGVENGILYVLRHPNQSASLTMPNATVTITYVSSNSTIVSTGVNGNTTRKVSAVASYASGSFTFSQWSEQ